MILERIYAKGQKNVRCRHKTTIEITKDSYLTPKGDCILGIEASKACYDLDANFKKYLRKGKKVEVIIKYHDLFDTFFGFGHNQLGLTSKKDMVFRKSDFLCDRTVLINCTKSSSELSRKLVNEIKKTQNRFSILFKKADFSNE
ncbi:MAG: hypothetical protein BAJALOKI3v1_740012 [Promethearchaeota archaeon]|jgi:hypothetical protein|nr:MAG: hypothetical protein BAJALOKI3v1_740012 [Candidatus Lokiarchaeota archaeon]